jgi:hypothetical protein
MHNAAVLCDRFRKAIAAHKLRLSRTKIEVSILFINSQSHTNFRPPFHQIGEKICKTFCYSKRTEPGSLGMIRSS